MSKDKQHGPSRAAVIRSTMVLEKTTIMLFRVRSVIQEKDTNNQLVAEEMLVWGFRGPVNSKTVLTKDDAINLLKTVLPTANLTDEGRAAFLIQELADIDKLPAELNDVANKRAEILVEAHERFRKVMSGISFKVVEPVLPMDLLGVYVILPDKSNGAALNGTR